MWLLSAACIAFAHVLHSTYIFQADTHPLPTKVPSTIDEVESFRQLTAVMALKYAKRHGYNYTFFVYGGSDSGECDAPVQHACYHPSFGARHAAWCSVLLVSHILRNRMFNSSAEEEKNAWIVNMDSDMNFRNPNISIEEYMERVKGMRALPRLTGKAGLMEHNKKVDHCKSIHCWPTHYTSDCDLECQLKNRQAALHVMEDGNTGGIMSGISFWNTTQFDKSQAILRAWWNYEHRGFPWEQGVLNSDVPRLFFHDVRGLHDRETYMAAEHQAIYRKLKQNSTNNLPHNNKGFLLHIVHFSSKDRVPWFSADMRVVYGMDDAEFSSLYRELISKYQVTMKPKDLVHESLYLFKEYEEQSVGINKEVLNEILMSESDYVKAAYEVGVGSCEKFYKG